MKEGDREPRGREPEGRDIAPCLGVLGLTYGEHLLVWTLRRLVARRSGCPLIAAEFTEVFGGRMARALLDPCVSSWACWERRPAGVRLRPSGLAGA